jgi:hypothetical protein
LSGEDKEEISNPSLPLSMNDGRRSEKCPRVKGLEE